MQNVTIKSITLSIVLLNVVMLNAVAPLIVLIIVTGRQKDKQRSKFPYSFESLADVKIVLQEAT
jgi:hypothetical protein